MEKAPRLLEDRSHSVLLAGVTLMQDICALEPAAVEAYRAHVPLLCRILRSLIMGGFAPGGCAAKQRRWHSPCTASMLPPCHGQH